MVSAWQFRCPAAIARHCVPGSMPLAARSSFHRSTLCPADSRSETEREDGQASRQTHHRHWRIDRDRCRHRHPLSRGGSRGCRLVPRPRPRRGDQGGPAEPWRCGARRCRRPRCGCRSLHPIGIGAGRNRRHGLQCRYLDRHDFIMIEPEEFDRVLKVNLYGSFHASQHAARAMLKDSGGTILFTASTSGVAGYRFYADYNASKGAIIAMMRTMALELAPKVRVNAVNPGYTLTPMQEAEYSPAMLRTVNDAIPMGRHARPEELAGLFAYLASDEAAYATVQVFTLDGGESTGTLAGKLSMSEM